MSIGGRVNSAGSCSPQAPQASQHGHMSLALLEQSLHDRRSLPPPPARRALRQAAGVSLLAVARACGVSRQAVAHWEAGTRQPRDEHLTAYLKALKLLREKA